MSRIEATCRALCAIHNINPDRGAAPDGCERRWQEFECQAAHFLLVYDRLAALPRTPKDEPSWEMAA